MSERQYSASQRPNRDGSGRVMSFRHPLRKDARGKQGLKVQKGLKTSDEGRANALVEQMNQLLQDTSWHSVAKRAEAERRGFDPIVVRAFYDEIETTPFISSDVRDRAIKLPTAEEGYAHVMMVGTTGAGKSSLLRHIIGSHSKRDDFPSTSASRTTIADIEVIMSGDKSYRGIVTFFSESAIHTNVHECVANACTALWEEITDDKLAERLLTHRDLRFRLGYIIGSWKQDAETGEAETDWEYTDGTDGDHDAKHSGDTVPHPNDLQRMHATLQSFLDRIRRLGAEARHSVQTELNVDLSTLTGSDKEEAQDRFEETVQSLADFDDLVNDIMEEIKRRLASLPDEAMTSHANGWPQSWYCETTDREEFLDAVRPFSSNAAAAFGTLLTPLVDGIRMTGQFFPEFTDRRPRLVLLDGEGLGHVTDSAAGVTSRIAKRFADVSVILLVDSAKAPMLEAPTSVLRAITTSGYQKKLGIAFTHVDLVRGQANLPTFEAQRAHIVSSVYQRLSGLKEIVGQAAVRSLERELEAHCFMLGFLDKTLTEKNRGPVRELLKLIDFCESAIEPEELPDVCPVYDAAGLVLAIQSATRDFHSRWDALLGFARSASTRTAHYNQVKALNRRIVLEIDNSEYRDLKPVADFVARLSESITKFLDRPSRWKPRVPTETEADEALSHAQREVFGRLHEFVEKRILRIPRQQWVKAFEYKGRGSTFDRARAIQTIYESATPIPGPALDPNSERFLREVRLLAHEAIREGGGELVSDLLAPVQ